MVDYAVDTAELEEVRELVSAHLTGWAGTFEIERVAD
jgi:hypothetical protein